MNFGGYVEGWATYAEMCSYYLMPLSKTQAAILQKNSSVILALYALADMGIHYEGWSRMDTVEFYARYGIKDAETVDKIYNLILGSPKLFEILYRIYKISGVEKGMDKIWKSIPERIP